jgi:hypothetical protein
MINKLYIHSSESIFSLSYYNWIYSLFRISGLDKLLKISEITIPIPFQFFEMELELTFQ